MQTEQQALIRELVGLTEKAVSATKDFKALSLTQLNAKKHSKAWSILECLEHLNLYGDFYLPEIEKQILANTGKSLDPVFKSGLIGNYFANLMKVENGKIKKMKSPKDKDPANSALTATTIDRQIKQLERLLTLLSQASAVNLTKVKTAISLTTLIKLRLGDTLRFVIYHIDRHIQQAQKNLA